MSPDLFRQRGGARFARWHQIGKRVRGALLMFLQPRNFEMAGIKMTTQRQIC